MSRPMRFHLLALVFASGLAHAGDVYWCVGRDNAKTMRNYQCYENERTIDKMSFKSTEIVRVSYVDTKLGTNDPELILEDCSKYDSGRDVTGMGALAHLGCLRRNFRTQSLYNSRRDQDRRKELIRRYAANDERESVVRSSLDGALLPGGDGGMVIGGPKNQVVSVSETICKSNIFGLSNIRFETAAARRLFLC